MSNEKPRRRWVILVPALIVLSLAIPFGRGAALGPRAVRAFQDHTPPAYASIAPYDLDFGKQVVGWTKPPRRIIVTNTGGQPLSVDSVATGGDHSGDFTIVNDTCTGATVAPNRACIVDVSFIARRAEDRRANLQLIGSAINSPQSVRLKGTGINSNDVPPF